MLRVSGGNALFEWKIEAITILGDRAKHAG
jgi:hypothetical protein